MLLSSPKNEVILLEYRTPVGSAPASALLLWKIRYRNKSCPTRLFQMTGKTIFADLRGDCRKLLTDRLPENFSRYIFHRIALPFAYLLWQAAYGQWPADDSGSSPLPVLYGSADVFSYILQNSVTILQVLVSK